MKIVLTGGGTGGHVIPHLSLLPYLKKHFNKIYYIGSCSFERDIMSKQKDVKYFSITTTKLQRDKFLKNLALPFKLLKSVCQAKKLLKELKPNVVFSKGGFVSVPVCIAAKLLKIPVVTHESDLSLGLSNKIIYKFCTTLCTTFPKTAQGLKKAIYTGSPLRQELFCGSKQTALQQTNLPQNSLPYLLIIGGSTGAESLNKTIFASLPTLTKHYNIMHITGKGKNNPNLNSVYKNYYQCEFCNNIQDLLALSDFIVSRAGSNAICEFLALNKPMLLVPLSNSASRGDQVQNANYFKNNNIAKVLNEENLTPTTLLKNLKELQNNKNLFIQNMKLSPINKNGTENILNIILKNTKKLTPDV